ILGSLHEYEVVASDLGRALQLAVDAAVALLHAARVPRHIEVEEVRAMILKVDALARCVGGDEDAERMLCWIGVERPLDLLARVLSHAAGERRDALARAVGSRDRCTELLIEVALGVDVFGEDDDAAFGP